MFITILIFIIVLGVLVLAHEFGHFIVAKRTGMKVEEFGFGFPPRVFGVQRSGGKFRWVWGHKEPKNKEATVYSLNWIPFGGFVKIMGENNEREEDPRSFVNRPAWARFLTLAAGVSMNWILAAVLFSLTFMIGVTSEFDLSEPAFKGATVTNQQIAIGYIAEGMPAQQAGLQIGDIVLSVDGKTFDNMSDLQNYIKSNKGQTFDFKVKRVNKTEDLQVSSQANPKEGEGPTGIGLTEVGTVRLPFFQSISLGVAKAANMTVAIIYGIYHIFTTNQIAQNVGGPVKIAQLTGEMASLGFTTLLSFMGLLSINLAILNALPLPALDGGRILFLAIEKIRRKRNNQRIEQWVNAAGFMALIFLMILVTAKDVGLGKLIGKMFGG